MPLRNEIRNLMETCSIEYKPQNGEVKMSKKEKKEKRNPKGPEDEVRISKNEIKKENKKESKTEIKKEKKSVYKIERSDKSWRMTRRNLTACLRNGGSVKFEGDCPEEKYKNFFKEFTSFEKNEFYLLGNLIRMGFEYKTIKSPTKSEEKKITKAEKVETKKSESKEKKENKPDKKKEDSKKDKKISKK